jgi:hypothetical protein
MGVLLAAGPSLAKEARCFTTDDGYYACNFQATGTDGSFDITADGYPSFHLEMDGPGLAFGSAKFTPDGNGTPLPGQYVRQSDDSACWANSETDTKICAW